MRFDYKERGTYTITTEKGGYVGTIQRIGDHFAFVDARHLRPAGAELIAVYPDELQEVVTEMQRLEAKIAHPDEAGS